MTNELWPGSGHFQQVARNPSRWAPNADEVLTPTANDQPADILVRSGARDVVRVDGRLVSLSLTGRSFITHGDALLKEHPIDEIRLIACAFLVEELAICPHWQKLHRLNLRGNQLGIHRLRVLLKQGLLAHLDAVDLRDNGLSETDMEELKRAFPLATAANSIRF